MPEAKPQPSRRRRRWRVSKVDRDALTNHNPQATGHELRLPPPRGRWPQAGGGGLFVRKWDVGSGRWGPRFGAGRLAFAAPKPPPRPSPKGRGTLSDANCKLRVFRWLQNFKPRAIITSHKPPAAFSRFPGRGRPGRPRSGAHAGSEARVQPPLALERRGGLQTPCL